MRGFDGIAPSRAIGIEWSLCPELESALPHCPYRLVRPRTWPFQG
jgi:hypothetical protein